MARPFGDDLPGERLSHRDMVGSIPPRYRMWEVIASRPARSGGTSTAQAPETE
jgi:hypothetical protein